jgi:predicted transcriptional regulator
MSAIALKEKLINKIQSTKDEAILKEVYRVLELELELTEKYMLSAREKKEIELGQKDILAGRYLTNDEVNNEIDEWLNK